MNRKRLISAMASAASGGLSPADPASIIWRAQHGVEDGTDNVVNQIVSPQQVTDAHYVGNNVLSFDGSGDYVDIPEQLDTVAAFTFSARFKSSVTGQTSYIAYQGDGGTSPGNTTIKLLFISGGLTFAFNGVQSSYGAANAYLDGSWHTAYIVHDGSGTAQVSVDSDAPTDIVGGSFTASTVTRIGSNGAGTSAFNGLICCVSHPDGTYQFSEGLGSIAYDVTGNSNHGTITGATWGTDDDAIAWNIKNGFRRQSSLYSAVEPSGGWVDEFNPNTADFGGLMDLISTLIYDASGSNSISYTITEPSGGWLRVFDPNAATTNDLYDVAATLANDLPSTASAYTLTPPTVNVYSFDPNTATTGEAMDALATLLIDLQTYGVIG